MLRFMVVTGLASMCLQIAAAQSSGSINIKGKVEPKCIVDSNGSLQMSSSDEISTPAVMVARACNAPGLGQLQLMHRALVDGEGVLAQFGDRSFNLDPSGLTNIRIRSAPEITAAELRIVSGIVSAPLRVVVRNSSSNTG